MFLSLVHLRDALCPQCGHLLAQAGARSFIVDMQGAPVAFSSDDPPEKMAVHLLCPARHTAEFAVPADVSAEECMVTPDDAPIGVDACLICGTTESGKAL